MQVQIDCDKRLKERGGTEYEGGWYYDWSGPRFASYSEAKRAAEQAGHEVDNAGWRRKLLMWNWHSHSMDGHPCPAFVKLTHVMGKDGDVESSKLCNEWDDIATVDFYQRDWTDDGIPWVRKDETYWSGWWFETIAERDRFVEWVRDRVAKVDDQSTGNRG
jgi:hypothetical protein